MKTNLLVSILLFLGIALAACMGATSRHLSLEHGALHLHENNRCLWTWRVPGLCTCNSLFCRRCHSGDGSARCKQNLKNVAVALELYAQTHGTFPSTLTALAPGYLTRLPSCPSQGVDTYSSSFQSTPTAYTVVCEGWNHHAVGYGADFPQYTSTRGLLIQ